MAETLRPLGIRVHCVQILSPNQASPPGEIARQDLVIRGPGEFLGAKQSGVPLLRFADIERDAALIEQARDAADDLLARFPDAAAAHLARWLGGKQDFFKA